MARPRRTQQAETFTSSEQVREAIRQARDPEEWRALRPSVAQYLLLTGAAIKDIDQARQIADAMWRRPELMPLPPPRGYKANAES